MTYGERLYFTLMKKRCCQIISLIVLFFLSFSHAEAYRVVIDTEGRKVKIPNKIQRVIVLTATCIETIYIIGEIGKVVGISRNMLESPFYSEVIKELRRIPVVSQDLRNLDLEKIIALKPDLIISIGPEHPFGMTRELVKKIEELGIPLVLLNLESLDENYYSIDLIGRIFNKENKTRELIEHMKNIERQVTDKVKNIKVNKRVKALMLSQKPVMILGGYWKSQDIIHMAGGINVASQIRDFVGEVSIEKIVFWNPDVITIVGTAPYSELDILNNPQLRNIKAVKNRRVYKYPYQLTGLFTPRAVLLLAWHASKFYPQLGIDWVKLTDEFFKKFYGITYYGPRT